MSHAYDQLRNRLREFVESRDWDQFHSPKNMAVCLSVEASELLAHYTWTQDSGEGLAPGSGPPDSREVAFEAADVLLSLMSFCHAAEIDLLAAAEEKLTRLGKKYPVALSRGSAVKDPTRKP